MKLSFDEWYRLYFPEEIWSLKLVELYEKYLNEKE